MGNLYDNFRLGKLMAIQGDMPVNAGVNNDLLIERGRHKQFSKTPTVGPYSSRYNNLIKLLQSDSPSSLLENIGPMAPLKLSIEEETVVIDGFPVESSCAGSSSAYGHNRRPMYGVVEDNISSFPGSKSQLIHRKEEQHSSCFSIKNNSPEAVAELEAPRCVSGQPFMTTENSQSTRHKCSHSGFGIGCLLMKGLWLAHLLNKGKNLLTKILMHTFIAFLMVLETLGGYLSSPR